MTDQLYLPPDWPPQPPPGQPGRGQGDAWTQLSQGKTIGKSVIVQFDAPAFGRGRSTARLDFLSVGASSQGDNNNNVLPLCLTICPIQFKDPATPGFVIPSDIQKVTGTQLIGAFAGATASPIFSNPYAEINWGAGGTECTAEVDILNGCCVNLISSFVRVRAFIDADVTTESMFYQLSAFLGPGRPKDLSGQRSVLVGNLNDGIESQSFPMPPFAKRGYLVGTAAAGAVFVGHLRFYRDNQGAASGFPVADLFYSGNQPFAAPIPNGGYYFTATNNSGFNSHLTAIFELGI